MKKKNYRYRKTATSNIKTLEELKGIEKACRIVAETLTLVGKHVKPGVETIELDRIAEENIRSKGARPAFKGYGDRKNPFPGTLCISIDDVVVHGIPGNRKLKTGEIVSIDCGAELDGFFGDSAVTFAVGEISDDKIRLMKVTNESLAIGIEQAVAGNKVYDISRAIQNYAESFGYTLTRELFGHGVGKKLHEEPSIPNFVPSLLNRNSFPNVKLFDNMTLAIEPMVHAGSQTVYTDDDGWTVHTADGMPAAHFEHTVVVKNGKAEILTLRD
jgi:methionyl aminopeptidase